eukprot:5521504-Prymnesium_polylepis.2
MSLREDYSRKAVLLGIVMCAGHVRRFGMRVLLSRVERPYAAEIRVLVRTFDADCAHAHARSVLAYLR